MSKKAYLKEVVLNSVIIFVSYLLAVVIRYRILRSEPGINALSTPYLMIAFMYSILISFTFDFEEHPRWLASGSSANSLYHIISKNALGCLLLLSAFYVSGIVYFSRWALFLFWIISSAGLIVRKDIGYGRTARKRGKGLDAENVLIIGDGELAERYIKSVTQNPQFGINIVGYMGKSERLRTDVESLFYPEEYIEPIIVWLGEYSLEKIEKINGLDEIVLTEQGLTDEQAKEILRIAQRKGIKVNLSLRHSPLILNETKIRDIGEAKLVGLNEQMEEKNYDTTGIVITIAVLLLIMIMKKFNMGALDTLRGFESYRSVLFGALGFFLFLKLSFAGKRKALFRRAGTAWMVSSLLDIVYEIIYSADVVKSIGTDILITTIVMTACLIISGIGEMLGQNDFIFLE